jgi:succinate dehydrogenase/fumarate reductase flavoprotein subunit
MFAGAMSSRIIGGKMTEMPWNTMDVLADIRNDLHSLMWDSLANRIDHEMLQRAIAKIAELCNQHEKTVRMNMRLEHLVHLYVKETEVRA